MSVSYKAFLVAGISLEEYFTKVGEKEETFSEYDKRGNKTGKSFTERKLIATLPDGGEIVIGEKFVGDYSENIKFDFYTSLGFDGDTSDQTFLGLYYNDYESTNLSNRIIGSIVSETNSVESVDVDKLNKTILEVRDELKEKFGHNGTVKLYLINYVSY